MHTYMGKYDDTILFIDVDLAQLGKMKLILCVFERPLEYTQPFGCEVSTYPFEYLGTLINCHKLWNQN